jgi:ribosomal protein S14
MKYIYFRNLKKRERFFRCESINRLLKSICVNEYLSYATRQNVFDYSNKRMAKSSYSRVVKSCNLTNRGRSINKYYKIGRIVLRDILNAGQVYGVKKSAW